MNYRKPRSWIKVRQGLVAAVCTTMFLPGDSLLLAQSTTPVSAPAAPASPAAPADAAAAAEPADAKLPAEQLDSLVAPIALYPDTLLAQALVASTYPLEIVQLQQWLVKNKDLKDKALTDAAAKQPWDPAIQGMAVIPDLVKRLADDIQWTTELGNAFLAQQSDVMDAVQRMRKKATDKGALTTNEQQKVETKVVEEKTVIIVEQANPEVIYVPSYNPTVVYGPPPVYYSYPPVYYPPPGYAFMSFSIGVAVGAAFWGGGCGWGHNEVNIDIDRNTNINGGDRNNNINGGDRGSGNRGNSANSTNRGGGSGGKSTWSHNPQHRGAAPYSNKSTASKFSGSTRAQSGTGNRSAGATQQSLGASSRSAGSGAGGSRPSSAGASAASRSSSAGSRSSSGGNNIGSRSMPSSSSRSGGFSGGSSGYSGSSARASSSRGASSMVGRGGGGGRRR